MTLQDASNIADIIMTVLTIAAIVYAALQIRHAKDSLKAQLINSLEGEFKDYYKTYHKLLPGRAWSNDKEGPSTDEELNEIEAYLEFFEKIKLLIDGGSIDISTIDKMFAFRFFLIINNSHAQNKVIYRDAPYFLSLFALHKEWNEYRTQKDRESLLEVTSLEKIDPEAYAKCITDYYK